MTEIAEIRIYAGDAESGAPMIGSYRFDLEPADDILTLDAWLDASGTRRVANSGGGRWFYRWYILNSGNHAHINSYPV